MEPLEALAVSLAAFGVVGCLLALRRADGRRRASAVGHGLLALLLLASSAVLWSFGQSLGTYEVFRRGRPVAELYFEQLADTRYRVTLTRLPGGRMQVFDIDGAAWRLDARTLTWQGWGAKLGLVPRYQLDRLTGLSSVPATGTAAAEPVSTFDLGSPEGLALWHRSRQNRQLQRIIEANHRYGPNVRMSDGARFMVSLNDTGLEALPANAAAATLATAAP